MLSSEQLRGARAILRWDQAKLASSSGVSIETVKRLEKLDGALGATRVSTVDALQRALEIAGVEFIPENGGGAGVRLRKRRDGMEGDHAKPAGPATDAIEQMEAEIAADRGKSRKK